MVTYRAASGATSRAKSVGAKGDCSRLVAWKRCATAIRRFPARIVPQWKETFAGSCAFSRQLRGSRLTQQDRQRGQRTKEECDRNREHGGYHVRLELHQRQNAQQDAGATMNRRQQQRIAQL